MSREYPAYPLVGVGAIIFRNSEVLLVRRGAEPARGKWSIPGGLMEVGEEVEEAVRREIREETGLEIEIGGLVEVINRVVRDEGGRVQFHYVLLDYWCRHRGGEPRADSDISEACWMPMTALDGLDMTRGTLPVIEKAYHMAYAPPGATR